jgi:hypothetical protein
MIKKMMAIVSLAALAGAASLVAPTTAKASGPSTYAVEQCGNGWWEELQYPTYEACYMAAVQFYIEQTGGAGSSGGSVVPGLPTWHPCQGTRIACNPSD